MSANDHVRLPCSHVHSYEGNIPASLSAVFFRLVCDPGLSGAGLRVPLGGEGGFAGCLFSLLGTGEAGFGVVAELDEGCELSGGVCEGEDAPVRLSIASRFWRIFEGVC